MEESFSLNLAHLKWQFGGINKSEAAKTFGCLAREFSMLALEIRILPVTKSCEMPFWLAF